MLVRIIENKRGSKLDNKKPACYFSTVSSSPLNSTFRGGGAVFASWDSHVQYGIPSSLLQQIAVPYDKAIHC